jgi:hypothetical protein
MAVTSKSFPSDAGRPQAARRPALRALLYGVVLALAAVAVYGMVGMVFGYLRVALDDLRYGRPRTYQLEAFVGHNESDGRPTHLMAINLNRQVTIIEIPGGDPSHIRTLTGPYLFGAREDLTPLTLSVSDVDGDGAPDLLVDVRQEQIVYLNRDGAFRLPTPEEQARLVAGGGR